MTLPVRLPSHVVPRRYRLSLDIDPAADDYLGEVEIALDISEPTRTIELHAVELVVDSATLTTPGQPDEREVDLAVRLEPGRDRLHLTAPGPIAAGPATLSLGFRGKLQRGLRGLYKVTDHGRAFAFTQFEPADARRAFPCFDEPACKAVFEISVTAPANLAAYSNGALLRSEDVPDGRREHHFAPTPLLSTYLVAVAVGELGKVQGQARARGGSVPVRVLAAPGKEHLGELALEMASAFLPILEEYFDIPYPYGKLDLLAAPDFEAGAMENAGLILFRESLLLLDRATASLDAQRQVAITVAHEMAHQWFGNLVTMEWWDDLWLNEAFATWMEFVVVDRWRPGWQLWTDFERMKAAPLHLDSLASTRPIQAAVRSPEQANEMFDGITYNKGAATLRMFEIFLGEDRFREGVRQYLKAHAGKNARAEALWAALSAASGQPVEKLAESWFTRPGYPLLTISTSDYKARVTQRRFFARPGHREATAPWAVPLAFKVRLRDGRVRRVTQLLEAHEGEVELGDGELLFGNAEGSGFYRVAYDAVALGRVTARLGELAPVERVSLLADQWAQVRAGAPLKPQLELLTRAATDSQRTVLETGIAQLSVLEDVVLTDGARPAFQRWVGSLLAPHLSRLGFVPGVAEDSEAQLLRPRLIEALGRLARDVSVRAEIQERLARWLSGEVAALPSSLVGVALRIAAQEGDLERWERFRLRMQNAANPEEHDRFLAALGSFEAPALVQKSLELSLGDEVRAQDLQILLGQMFFNREARRATWAFVVKRWGEVSRKAPVFGLRRVLAATAQLVDPKLRDEIEAFFSDPAHHVEAGERELRQALEAIDLGLELQTREAGNLEEWLAGR